MTFTETYDLLSMNSYYQGLGLTDRKPNHLFLHHLEL